MKHNIIRLLTCTVLCLGVLGSCSKKGIVDNDKQVGISKITYYATFTMAGDPYMSVVKGQTFTDPGVTATQNGTALTVTTSGTVDVTTVGIYTITYSATNSDGYPASTTRTVAVLPAAETAGVDISGTYYYVATPTATAVVSKLAPGFYAATNCYSGATTIPIQFLCVDGVNLIIPVQATAYGALNGTGTLSATGALQYVISIPSQGITNRVRNWQLQ
jgi:hypothetical protein